jgi:hypothetical protein
VPCFSPTAKSPPTCDNTQQDRHIFAAMFRNRFFHFSSWCPYFTPLNYNEPYLTDYEQFVSCFVQIFLFICMSL